VVLSDLIPARGCGACRGVSKQLASFLGVQEVHVADMLIKFICMLQCKERLAEGGIAHAILGHEDRLLDLFSPWVTSHVQPLVFDLNLVACDGRLSPCKRHDWVSSFTQRVVDFSQFSIGNWMVDRQVHGYDLVDVRHKAFDQNAGPTVIEIVWLFVE